MATSNQNAEEKLAAIEKILAQPYLAEYAVQAIREVVFGGAVTELPKWTDTGSGAGYTEGAAWERHDDPHADDR